MNSIQGVIERNGLYFQHADFSEVQITINGVTVYNVSSCFPHHTSNRFYNTLASLVLQTHNSLTFDTFNKGRTASYFNFVTEDVRKRFLWINQGI